MVVFLEARMYSQYNDESIVLLGKFIFLWVTFTPIMMHDTFTQVTM